MRSSTKFRRAACAAAALVLSALTARVALAQSPSTLVQRAAAAMGGEAALRSLTSTNYEFNAAAFGIGQEESPASPARATLSYGRIVTDYRGVRRTTSQESRAITGVITRQRRIVTGGIGMTETNGTQTPDAPGAVAAATADVRLLPDRLVLAALDNPGALSALAARRFRGELMDGVRYANGADTISLWFDRLNGILVVAERVTDDGVLGDRRNTAMYTRWADAGGVKLPREIDSEANGRLVQHTVITTASTNGSLDETMFAIPDSIARRAQRGAQAVAPIVVSLVEIGPNVWRAEGQTHHSLVIKQANGLLVVEMPQSSARSRAVLDTLKSRFPGVRVHTAVSTHHHWDHSGGVREYLAQGIPVVTHRRNVEFIRGIAAAKKTVAPDALSRAPRTPVVRAATDTLSIGTGDTRVQFFELANTHVEGMLVAYVPSLRILFVADVIQPGPGMSPVGSREVMALVRARGITVDRVVGAHAGIVPWADVVAAAAR
jgi:glyoxylase-like metal-dependent hydrolase (beta-lactamase superfamily II)